MIAYFLIFLSWLTGLFIVGYIVSFLFLKSYFKPTFYESVLRNVFLGYILTIVIHSVFKTEFKTINLVILIILLFALFEIRKHKAISSEKSNNFKLKYLFPLLFAVILLYAYSWLEISNADGFLKFWENEDYILYSKISKYIALTGHENESNVLNLMDNFYIGSEPYHYFDLWGGACVSNIFGINHYISLKLIIYPTFFFLYAVGIFALFNKNSLMSYVSAFALLLVGGITYQFNTNINFLNNLDNIAFNLLNPVFLKLSYFYVFIISAYLLYKNNLFLLAFLCMLILPVANIITLPTILPALFLILMIGYFNKTIDKPIALKCFIYLIVSFISIILFYVLFKRQSSGLAGVDPTSPMKLINENLQLINFKTQLNIIGASILGIIIIYLPFILLIINDRRFYKIREYKSNTPLLFVVIGISVSILVWCALYPELNSRQIHQNLSIPLMNVLFAIYAVNFLNKNYSPVYSGIALRKFSIILLLILIMQNLFLTIHFATDKRSQTYSAEYLSQIKKNLIDNTFVASLKSESKEEVNSKYNFGYTLGDYLFLMNENVNPVNIGDFNILIDSSSTLNFYRIKKAVSDGIFYRYCQFPENIKMKKDELMLKFMKQYRIKQMIVSKNAIIPDTLRQFVDEIITDSVSGERFVWLKLDDKIN